MAVMNDNGIYFYVLLTVHPGIILVNNQIEAQFFLACLFLFSTRFGQSDKNQVSHCYNNSPDDGHMAARNVWRIEINTQEKIVRQVVYLQRMEHNLPSVL